MMYKQPSQQFNGVCHLKILGDTESAARSAHTRHSPRDSWNFEFFTNEVTRLETSTYKITLSGELMLYAVHERNGRSKPFQN